MRDLNQLAAKKETTPGTAMTGFTSADVYVRLRDESAPDISADPIETGEMQASSSSRPVGMGIRNFKATASWVLRPSATPLTAAPPSDIFLEMGLLKRNQIKSIAIGAVTGGPFKNLEIIRVAGVDRGIVFRDTAATPLKYYVIAGAIASAEVITGATSGATATASAGPTDAGQLYMLTDSDFIGAGDSKHHCTLEWMRGGYFWQGRGVIGELTWQFRNGLPCYLKQDLVGAWSSEGDKAMYSISTYPDEAQAAPRFVNAQFVMDGFSPTDIVDFNLNLPLGIELREDANDASPEGVRFADYDRRNSPPVITFEPAMVSKATYDFFGKYKAESTFAATWKLGTKFTFYADECQLVGAGAGARRSLATTPIQLRLCGKTNNEIQIYAA